MRIVYAVTRADEIGGAQVHVRDLASAMHAAGHEVTVLAGMPGVLIDQLARGGVPFRPVPDLVRAIAPHRDFAAWRQLKALFRELQPDLISTHSSKAGWLGRLAARQLRIPVIFTAHGWAFTEGVPRAPRTVYALAERLMSPLADRIITVSEYDRSLALDYRIAPPDKIISIHNGVHGCEARTRQSTASGVRIVMIGRFSPQKDHASLLRALARLGQLNWTLDLVGDGSLQAQAIALAESLGIRERVRFLGALSDVCGVLRQADVDGGRRAARRAATRFGRSELVADRGDQGRCASHGGATKPIAGYALWRTACWPGNLHTPDRAEGGPPSLLSALPDRRRLPRGGPVR